MNKIISSLAIAAACTGAAFAAEPKRLLVVTANNGFRHSSIEIMEKVIRELSAKSKDFVVISTMDHPDYPDFGGGAGSTNNTAFGNQINDGTPGQITYIRKLNDKINSPLGPLQAAVLEARKAVSRATFTAGANAAALKSSLDALSTAELAFARAKADAFVKLQASDNRLSDLQVQVLMGNATSAAVPRSNFAPQVGAATPKQQKAIRDANTSASFVSLVAAVTAARSDVTAASLALPRDNALIAAKAGAVASAEQALATARATEFARIQSTAGKFAPTVVQTLLSRLTLPETGNLQNDGTAKVFADMLSPAALKNYDGVFFDSTVGELPFPDKAAFMKWVENGGAWLGNHAATDSMHQSPEWYAMTGGEFTGHGNQTTEVMTVIDTTSPMGKAFGGKTITIRDEMYTFENQYMDLGKVHQILSFTSAMNDGRHTPVGAPGVWANTWITNYGKGRVFYTALGHREDVVDPVMTAAGEETRQNPPEVAYAFQKMVLAGIRWGLKLDNSDATPQAAPGTRAGGPGISGGRGGVTPAPQSPPPTGRGGF